MGKLIQSSLNCWQNGNVTEQQGKKDTGQHVKMVLHRLIL